MDIISEYYEAKEHEESIVIRINDSYLEALDALKELEAENAKLREIIVTLVFCANDEADCDKCPMNGIHCDEVQSCFCDEMANELRELGMEIKNGLEAQV